MGHEPSNLPLVYPARRGAEAASAPRGVRGSYGSPLSFCSLLCRKRLKKKNNVLDYERQDLNLYPAPYQGATIPFKLLSQGPPDPLDPLTFLISSSVNSIRIPMVGGRGPAPGGARRAPPPWNPFGFVLPNNNLTS